MSYTIDDLIEGLSRGGYSPTNGMPPGAVREAIRKWERTRDNADRAIKSLEKRLASLRPSEPLKCGDGPTVITFQKKWPSTGKLYDYAAIRTVGPGTEWAITQTSAAETIQPVLTWAKLLDFIGEEQWLSICTMGRAPRITINTGHQFVPGRYA